MINNLLLFCIAAFASGVRCAGEPNLQSQLLYALIVSLLCGIMFLFWRHQYRALLLGLIILFFIGGMLRVGQVTAVSPNDISHYIGRTLTLEGTVADVPKVSRYDDQTAKVRYVLEVNNASANGKNERISGMVVVNIQQSPLQPIAQYGDRVQTDGKIIGIHGYNNPGVFDSEGFLRRAGISARLLTKPDRFTVFHTIDWHWQTVLAEWRTHAAERMQAVMLPEQAAVLNGMLFGGYGGIGKDVVSDFATTGIVHILSVSGTHIALVAGAILWLGTRLNMRKSLVMLVAAGGIILYAFLAGLFPPVVRSGVMGLVSLAAIGFGRQSDAPAALAFSGIGMLWYQPLIIYDVSFQLSFGATAGLLFLYQPTVEAMSSVPKWLSSQLALTWAAQLGVLPFLAWHFNSFSLSAFVANILVVPIVEMVVILGLIGVIVGSCYSIGGNLILGFCGMLIALVVNITAFLANFPAAAIFIPTFTQTCGLLYYVLVAWLYGYKPAAIPGAAECVRKWPKVTVTVSLGVILTGCVYYIYPQPVAVHFIDVGQGDAALLVTPHGRAILIDTGGTVGDKESEFDIGERVVVPYLKHYGIVELDYLILTHGHQDHAGGAAGVASKIPVRNIMLPCEEYSLPVQKLLKAAKRSRFIPQQEGQQILLDGVKIEFVQCVDSEGIQKGNEVSSVIRIQYGAHSFLVTGDMEAKGEARMLSEQKVTPTTILKVAHHGSRGSTTPAFLEALNPGYAVVSVGAYNHFGHPHPDTLQRLANHQIQLWRTDKNGAVVFFTDGENLRVRTFVKDKETG